MPQPSRRDAETLARYLRAVRDIPPLSREEEHALAVRARQGDVRARQQLVRQGLGFVVALARKQRRGAVPLDDLIQEGNVGLMLAAEKFDPHAGTRFLTYASWWARAYIGKYLKEARSAVRPLSGTVAQADLSLDVPLEGDGGATYLERLQDERPGPEQRFMREEGARQVREALGRVHERLGGLGRDIVHERLARDTPRTLVELGERWGLSRERVRQVEVKTKQLLQRYLQPLAAPGEASAA